MNPEPLRDFLYDAFVSYSSRDADWVRSVLVPRLEAEGLRVCIDYRDFGVGIPSLRNMETAVDKSCKTILVLTPNWIASAWTEFESLLAQTKDPAGRGRRLLPILLQPCALPDRLRMLTYLDMTNASNFDQQVRRLIAAIRSAPASGAPTPPQSVTATRGSSSRGFDYGIGLEAVRRHFTHFDRDTQLLFAVLESRLMDNLEYERRYGTDETTRSDRARIVSELNRLALDCIGLDFNSMCLGRGGSD